MPKQTSQFLRIIGSALCLMMLLTLSLSLVACEPTRVNRIEQANPQANPNIVDINKVQLSGQLASRVNIQNIFQSNQDGLLRIQVNALNKTSKGRSYQYRFDWFDTNGMIVGDGGPASSWQTGYINAGEVTRITGIAPSPDIVDWTVTIKNAERN